MWSIFTTQPSFLLEAPQTNIRGHRTRIQIFISYPAECVLTLMSHIAALQDHLCALHSAGAYRSAEVLAQGLLIEAPATTSTASSARAPLVGAGSPVRTLHLLADALAAQGENARAVAIYRQALQLLGRFRSSLGGGIGNVSDGENNAAMNCSNASGSVSSSSVSDHAGTAGSTTTLQATLNTLHCELSTALHAMGDTRAAIEALGHVPPESRSIAIHLRLGRMHLALVNNHDASPRAARDAFAAAWVASPFCLEAARALIDLGQHTADDVLALCSQPDLHARCAPWIPTLIQAYSYERQFAPREAMKCLESLGAAFDTSLDCVLQKARLRLQLMDVSGAIQLYERAHRLDEHNCTDMDLYAMCLFERRLGGDAAKLNALAQHLIANVAVGGGGGGGISTTGTVADRPEPWIVAALHAMTEKDARAEALVDQALRADPCYANAHFVKGLVLVANDNTGGSVQCLRRAMKLQPSIRTYKGMFHAYIADEQYAMALGIAKELQKKMPSEVEPLVLLGTVYGAQYKSINNGVGARGAGSREAKRAKLAFERALKIEPSCDIAVYKLVELHFACMEHEEAVEVLKSALKYTKSARLHALLGQALSELTRLEGGVLHYHEAAEHFQHALALDPRNGDALRGQEKLESLMKGEDPDKSMDQDDDEEDF